MHRFYLRPELCQDNVLLLEDEEAHHAFNVLRLRPGTPVTVLNGLGGVWSCAILDCSRRQVHLEIHQSRQIPPPPFQIILFQAILKGKTMEWLLQKATELGVHRIVPILTEHTVPQLDGKHENKKHKWQAIVREALKQSGNPWLPLIDSPLTLQDCLRNSLTHDISLLADLGPDVPGLNHWLIEYQTRKHRSPATIGLWIGPEGDFTQTEKCNLLSAGVHPITLGPRTLRSETAAICGLSILNHELDRPFHPS